jgi:hypothetical protein
MKTFTIAIATTFAGFAALLLALPVLAEDTPPAGSAAASPGPGGMDPQMMAKMMEMTKLNENHKLLQSLDGKWNYTVKMWMNGDASSKPDLSHGSATRQSIMGGRYVVMDVKGNMEMPGADGKTQKMEFKGRGTEGYDNVQKKFVATWLDNMGTGIMMMQGTYDEPSKTFTYTGEFDAMPGMHQKVRESLKLTDKDHMMMEWFEDRGGKEVKTMEIDYARQK